MSELVDKYELMRFESPWFLLLVLVALLAVGIAVWHRSPTLIVSQVQAYREAMPPVQVLTGPDDDGQREMRGSLLSHVMALKNDPNRTDDVYDVLIDELTR